MGKHSKPRRGPQARAMMLSVGLIIGAGIGVGASAMQGDSGNDFVPAEPTSTLTAETFDIASPEAVEINYAACPPTARACVDLTAKKSWLQKNGNIEYGPVDINSGQPGWETPHGTFHIMRKVKDEVSLEFNYEKMPWSTYFSPLGIAFHEGDLSQQSHGCIHLSSEAAQHYFRTLAISDGVVVF